MRFRIKTDCNGISADARSKHVRQDSRVAFVIAELLEQQRGCLLVTSGQISDCRQLLLERNWRRHAMQFARILDPLQPFSQAFRT